MSGDFDSDGATLHLEGWMDRQRAALTLSDGIISRECQGSLDVSGDQTRLDVSKQNGEAHCSLSLAPWNDGIQVEGTLRDYEGNEVPYRGTFSPRKPNDLQGTFTGGLWGFSAPEVKMTIESSAAGTFTCSLTVGDNTLGEHATATMGGIDAATGSIDTVYRSPELPGCFFRVERKNGQFEIAIDSDITSANCNADSRLKYRGR
jgi:hypothetical protein